MNREQGLALLLPFFPLADLLKHPKQWITKTKHFRNSTVMCVVDYQFGIHSGDWISTILLPFYILYSYNTLMDSVFYGKGRTELLAYQSIMTVSVYGTAFLLFQAETSIALLFGTGIAVDSIVLSRCIGNY